MRVEAELTYQNAVRLALHDALAADRSVVLWGEDIGCYGGAFGVTRGLLDEFGPSRVVDTPISEAAVTGMAVGAAMLGMRPVVEIMFMDFVSLTMDALCNLAAKIHYMLNGQYRVPMVVRTPMGAGRGYGPSHSQSLGAWFAHIPGLKVVAPATVEDAYGLLRAAINDPNPVLFLEHKLLYAAQASEVPLNDGEKLEGARIRRPGRDVTLVTCAHGVTVACRAAALLSEAGIEAEVVDVRVIRPLDAETVTDSCSRTGRALILCEEYPFGGIAAELCAQIQARCWASLKAPVARLTGADTPIPCAPSMEAGWLPTADDVCREVKRLFESGAGGR